MKLFSKTHLPPLLPPISKTCQILKYITSATFCTKNETYNYIRSTYMSILISKLIVQQNRWFCHTIRFDILHDFAIFLQKSKFQILKSCIFGCNGRTNLIFDSGKIWGQIFFKKWYFKKGGKGGASIRILVGVMITWKITDLTSETAIRASYQNIFDRSQYLGMLPPPFASPFIFNSL